MTSAASSTIASRSLLCVLAMLGSTLVAACAAETAADGGEAQASASEDVKTRPAPGPIGTPSHGIMEGGCGVGSDLWCASQVYGCLPACIDSSSDACHVCIDATFTAGVDCWSCLFGGGGSAGGVVQPSSYYACKYFPGDPDVTSNPRIRTSGGKIGELCDPSVYNTKTRAWQRECCLYRVR